MKLRTIAGEILPVIGTIGLLGLWLYQQTEIEKKAGELRQISSARNVYQTYQSNNAIFNAIEEVASKDKSASSNIRNFQVYNYELGLAALEQVLSDSEKINLPEGKTELSEIMEDTQGALDSSQKRLEMLQYKLIDKEKTITQTSKKLREKYFWAYICFSVISIMGAILKISDKMANTKSA